MRLEINTPVLDLAKMDLELTDVADTVLFQREVEEKVAIALEERLGRSIFQPDDGERLFFVTITLNEVV